MSENAAVPRAEYSRRLAELSVERSNLQSRERLVGYIQLGLGAFCLAWILFRVRHFTRTDLLVLVPITTLIVIAVLHGRLLRVVAARTRAIRFYEQGLARLNGTWAGSGATGERFLQASDPCARDLDLFGRASLFELLCTARTRAGEEALARWLIAPASPDVVRARQAAAIELSPRLRFRESLSTMGEDVAIGVRPAQLADWGEGQAGLPSGMIRILAPVLAAAWIFSVAAWQLWGAPELLVLATTVVNLGISYRFRRRLSEEAHAAEDAGHDLSLLSQVLTVFESEKFSSPKLLQLQAQLKQLGLPPSRAIAKLNRLVEYLVSAHHLFVRVLDFVIFYRLQFVLATESWRRRFGPSLRLWLEAVGELEALAALGGYTYEHPEDVFPEFAEDAPYFEAEALAHPLIPRERAVANDLRLGPGPSAHHRERSEYGRKKYVPARHRRQCRAGAERGSGACGEAEAVASYRHCLDLRSGFAGGWNLALLCGDPSAKADHGPDQGPCSGSFSAGRAAVWNQLARSADRNPIHRHQTGGTRRGGVGKHA